MSISGTDSTFVGHLSIRRVINFDDISVLLSINAAALEEDSLVDWFELYSECKEIDHSRIALTGALSDKTNFLFKAVITRDDGTEQVVGFVHWIEGSIPRSEAPDQANSEATAQQTSEGQGANKLTNHEGAEENIIENPVIKNTNSRNLAKDRSNGQSTREERIKKGTELLIRSSHYYSETIGMRKHICKYPSDESPKMRPSWDDLTLKYS